MPDHPGIGGSDPLWRNHDPIWIADGGDLPLAEDPDKNSRVWLFTCCNCGKRWADPPAPVAGCSCGSEQIVCHRFDHDIYRNLRIHGQRASPAGGAQ